MAGRPSVTVELDVLEDYVKQGLAKSSMAALLNVSRPTLDKLLDRSGLAREVAYSVITDEEIDDFLLEAKRQLPLMGERLIIGFFNSKG